MSHRALKLDGGPAPNEIIGLQSERRKPPSWGKNAMKRFQKKGPEPRYGRLGGLVDQARMALRELVIHTGMKVFQGILEEDRAKLCGPRYLHQEGRDAYRHGSDDGVLVFGGRKVRCRKPRVRGLKGGELSLPTWEQMQSEDPLEHLEYCSRHWSVSAHGGTGAVWNHSARIWTNWE